MEPIVNSRLGSEQASEVFGEPRIDKASAAHPHRRSSQAPFVGGREREDLPRAVTRSHFFDPKGLVAGEEPVLVEELVLVTAPGHALAGDTARLSLDRLAGQPLISMAPGHPSRAGVEAALARAGATPSVLVETPGYALVCALVSAGLGVAVVPEMVGRTAVTPVGVRQLEPGDLRRTISVAHRTDEAAPAADAFRALLRGAFGRAAQRN